MEDARTETANGTAETAQPVVTKRTSLLAMFAESKEAKEVTQARPIPEAGLEREDSIASTTNMPHGDTRGFMGQASFVSVSEVGGTLTKDAWFVVPIARHPENSMEPLLPPIERHPTELPSKNSFLCVLARLLDGMHPTHKLQTTLLTYPLNAPAMLRRRFTSLGYEVPSVEVPGKIGAPEQTMTHGLDSAATINGAPPGTITIFDAPVTLFMLAQMDQRLGRDLRFYYEFSGTINARWCVGLTSCQNSSECNHDTYPGATPHSFGFAMDGTVWHAGENRRFIEAPFVLQGQRTFGVVLDMYHGCIHLAIDGRVMPPAFGKDSPIYSPAEQELQRQTILQSTMVPMLALKGKPSLPAGA